MNFSRMKKEVYYNSKIEAVLSDENNRPCCWKLPLFHGCLFGRSRAKSWQLILEQWERNPLQDENKFTNNIWCGESVFGRFQHSHSFAQFLFSLQYYTQLKCEWPNIARFVNCSCANFI